MEITPSNSRLVYRCPACKTKIPFGTETTPPPDHCPTCRRELSIPTVLQRDGRPFLVSRAPLTEASNQASRPEFISATGTRLRSLRSVKGALKWPAIAWAIFVVATGFYVDSGAGAIGGVAAIIALTCLTLSLQGWWHLAALPLYLFFAGEVLLAMVQTLSS